MRSAFSQTRTLTKCALQARFLFTNFTENLQFEEKKEYADILSSLMLICTLKVRIILRLHYFLVIELHWALC